MSPPITTQGEFMTTTQSHLDDTDNENTTAISVRNVDKDVWHDFKKLAVIHDMSIQDYLKYLVEKEMSDVQISTKRKRS